MLPAAQAGLPIAEANRRTQAHPRGAASSGCTTAAVARHPHQLQPLPATTSTASCRSSTGPFCSASCSGSNPSVSSSCVGANIRFGAPNASAAASGSQSGRRTLVIPFAARRTGSSKSRTESGGDTGSTAGDSEAAGASTASTTTVPGVTTTAIVERIEDRELYDEAYNSYLSYAMSVIVGRAIPDVRDGLKPVHRRILFAMHELGLEHSKPFKKCARVVGEVLGKFHPHGDSAVYDTLVRMAQPFAMRETLVDGHGNFGSLDADPAAAMRYTECRLAPLAGQVLLRDLENKEAVDWLPTFDASQEEPVVLPAVIPNLLVNGSSGIAVGLASHIPPHNLGEVVAALKALIADPRVTTEQLMQHVKGPDFPTGGQLVVGPELLQAYATGRGSLIIRGKVHFENTQQGQAAATAKSGRSRRGKQAASAAAAAASSGGSMSEDEEMGGGVAGGGRGGGGGGKELIVITEMPYQVYKSELVAAIAGLADQKVVEGVADVRDESDRTGVRVVVEVKRGFSAEALLAKLYKHTRLETAVHMNCVSLAGAQPRLMGLKEMLELFLEFRCEVVRRRSAAVLRSAQSRAHLVSGFLRVLSEPGRLDAVVAAVRGAADGAAAREALVAEQGLSKEQAEAVLGLTLRRLTGLEAAKLEKEGQELAGTISQLQHLLSDHSAVLAVVTAEADQVAARFNDPRRTQLLRPEEVVISSASASEPLPPARPCLLLSSRRGFLRRLSLDALSQQNRNTRGKSCIRLRSGDSLSVLTAPLECDQVLLVTPTGKAYQAPVAAVPGAAGVGSAAAAAATGGAAAGGSSGAAAAAAASPSGASVANVLKLDAAFPIAALLPVPHQLAPPAKTAAPAKAGAAAAAAAAAMAAAAEGAAGEGLEGEGGKEDEVEVVAEDMHDDEEGVEGEGEGEGEEAGQEGGGEGGEERSGEAGPSIVLCSRQGRIKRIRMPATKITRSGITVMNFGPDSTESPAAKQAADEVGWAALAARPDDVVALVSEQGQALLFEAGELRLMGRASRGIKAMKLSSVRRPGDRLADVAMLPAELAASLPRRGARSSSGSSPLTEGAAEDREGEEEGGSGSGDEEGHEEEPQMEGGGADGDSAAAPAAPAGPCLLVVTAHGSGKRIPLDQLMLGLRNQAGLRIAKLASAAAARKSKSERRAAATAAGGSSAAAATRGADRIVAALLVNDGDEVMLASRNGVVVRQAVDGITVQGRYTRGTFVMELDEGDAVADVAVVPTQPPAEAEAAEAEATAGAAEVAAEVAGKGAKKGRGRGSRSGAAAVKGARKAAAVKVGAKA